MVCRRARREDLRLGGASDRQRLQVNVIVEIKIDERAVVFGVGDQCSSSVIESQVRWIRRVNGRTTAAACRHQSKSGEKHFLFFVRKKNQKIESVKLLRFQFTYSRTQPAAFRKVAERTYQNLSVSEGARVIVPTLPFSTGPGTKSRSRLLRTQRYAALRFPQSSSVFSFSFSSGFVFFGKRKHSERGFFFPGGTRRFGSTPLRITCNHIEQWLRWGAPGEM